MGGEFPPLNTRQVEQVLTAAGFSCGRSVGSHFFWKGYCGGQVRSVTVKKIPAGAVYDDRLLKSMIRQSGMTRWEFYALLK